MRPTRPQTSGLCVASLVLGIFGLCSGLTAVLAVIFGHLGLSKVKSSGGRLAGGGMAVAGLVMGYFGLLVVGIFVAIMFAAGRSVEKKQAEAGKLFDVASVPVPAMPDLPEFEPVGDKGVRVGAVEISDGVGPGESMWMWIYLPPGDPAPGSLSAVLVAPAGTNLLSGSDLGPLGVDDYHDECLPYAEAGMAVVFYSIDGEVEDEEDDGSHRLGYEAFRDACAGVVNGRNALEYVFKRMPEVDTTRIYSAGHSSAGTLSLLFGAHEPRLAGSIAYAPAADVVDRLQELIDTPLVNSAFPQVKHFAKRSSPMTHVAEFSRPVFLFHAEDDENVPAEKTEEFASALKAAGADVTLRISEEGGHYVPMITEGIPAGIEWIRAQ
ncbi:aminopeptidase acylaminoacyl-peptidase-like protein [Haloferula helveola]|uniref:Aminopeptidase acylaminoacyl-peptidase-like protein n=2 Tax=Haloferula helveola TaxID=490095 RepID=A0ABM7RKZ5_9BACT|nr:aminopeptidase acylaminoacyl-peptidase-like protein [Haloferula helveola]